MSDIQQREIIAYDLRRIAKILENCEVDYEYNTEADYNDKSESIELVIHYE